MIFFSIPWPHKDLSPNARTHWAALAKRKAAYRTGCGWEALQAFNAAGKPEMSGVTLRIIFHPPCARRRDLDNCLASIKAGLDGIADVIGVDDSKWALVLKMDAPTALGRVFIDVVAAEVKLPLRGTINSNERKA